MLATLVMCPSILDQRIRMYSAVFASHSGGGRTLNTERVCLFTLKKKRNLCSDYKAEPRFVAVFSFFKLCKISDHNALI